MLKVLLKGQRRILHYFSSEHFDKLSSDAYVDKLLIEFLQQTQRRRENLEQS